MIFPAGDAATAVSPSAAPPEVDRTRNRVRQAISEHGPVTAAELAGLLGLTPAAVRRHLDGLAADGLVEEHEKAPAARRRGRPARAWVLSEAGHADLGDGYAGLAGDVLRHLAEHGGPDAVGAFARDRATGLAARLAPDVTAHDDLPGRTRALARALHQDGFAATARPVGAGALAGIQLCQGHCPVREVAAQFPQLCDAEAEAFSALLGVHVQRLATQAQGDHVCTTFVPLPETVTSGTGSAPAPAAGPRSTTATERYPR